MPSVSILMPLYNAELWIEESIRSCKEQTYGNWELIVVDDGSTDSSADIVERLASEDHRIRLYRQQNAGASAARNEAFRHCSGDYVMYLDADDLMSPNKIESQIKALESAPKNSIATCPWEEFWDKPSNSQTSRPIYHDYDKPTDLLIEMWSEGSFLQTSCYLVPRDLISCSKGWNKKITLNDDGEFFCRILANTSKIVFASNAIVNYRRGHSSLSTAAACSETKQRSRLDSFISYEETLLPIDDTPRLRRALARNYALIACATLPNSTLFTEAFAKIQSLGLRPQHPYPLTIYGKIANLIGLKLYLILRSFVKKTYM